MAMIYTAMINGFRQAAPDIIFDDCGHVPMLEYPERFVDTVVAWLDA